MLRAQWIHYTSPRMAAVKPWLRVSTSPLAASLSNSADELKISADGGEEITVRACMQQDPRCL